MLSVPNIGKTPGSFQERLGEDCGIEIDLRNSRTSSMCGQHGGPGLRLASIS